MAYTYDIVLLTEDRFDNPPILTDYINNILLDDKLLTAALEKYGLRVIRKSWSDSAFDWSTVRFAIFRTIWDYFIRYDQFKNWLETTSQKTQFINALSLVKWNMDKHYFVDLNQKGIHTVATQFIEIGSIENLKNLFENQHEELCIIKPAVSGAARHTCKLNEKTIAEIEPVFNNLIQKEAFIIQPFQKEIIEKGEVSMMVIGGNFTHAVLKKSKPGDFRVQDDFGGTLHDYIPNTEEINFAEAAVRACAQMPLYARVDIIRDNTGALAIMELEIIEPELWFRRFPEAADKRAFEISKLL